MQAAWVRRLVDGLLFTILSVMLCVSLTPKCFSSDDLSSMGKITKPWMMISMTPAGCSGGCQRLVGIIKKVSGNLNSVTVHYSEVTPEYFAEKNPEFIVLSPQGTPWCRYSGERGVALQNFLWTLQIVVEDLQIPILGICGGHQALALAFGGKVGPVRAGADDCMPYSRDRQGGVVPLTVTSPDPIFEGLESPIRILESHYDEVKILPPGFVLLASEKVSKYQIIRHASQPVYGIQGHPEYFYSNRPDGGMLIKNFLKIAREHNREVRREDVFESKVSSAGETIKTMVEN
jgi:GMP synthase (glutamine-hydrolysing)